MPVKDLMEATYLGNLMGQKAFEILEDAKTKPPSDYNCDALRNESRQTNGGQRPYSYHGVR